MKKVYDDQAQEILRETLDRLRAYTHRWAERRERQLWKEVELPCHLHQALSRLAKYDMSTIRQNYAFNKLSALNKEDLTAALAERIPIMFKRVLYRLDQSRYDLVKMIVSNEGVIADPGMSLSNAQALVDYSIIYPGTHGGRRVLFMPEELVDAFLRLDGAELENIVRRNTEWILLVHGLLYFYGVMDAWHVRAKVEELTGQRVDLLELQDVMSFASDFYKQVHYCWSNLYRDSRVFDINKIVEEHRMRPGVDYYPFTKEQLLKAGNPDYVHKTPALRGFLSFISRYYDLSAENANEIALQLTNMIAADANVSEVFKYLEDWLEIPSLEFLHALTKEVQELCNNTRRWSLKGHTPAELFQEERKHLLPLPGEPYKLDRPVARVVELPTRSAKVGRNDPCPCGSGQKHKKCCGK